LYILIKFKLFFLSSFLLLDYDDYRQQNVVAGGRDGFGQLLLLLLLGLPMGSCPYATRLYYLN
jgi:hypothetical protein